MPREVPLVEESCDGRLKELRAVVRQTTRLTGECVVLLVWHHQISQAKAWKQHLAEGTGVEHAALAVTVPAPCIAV